MKLKVLLISVLFSISLFSAYQEDICLVEIDPPDPQLVKKRSLLINTEDILAILNKVDISKMRSNIEFATIDDYVIARLGRIEKGEISWAQKIKKEKFLIVKYGKSDYKPLLEKVRSGVGRPGYQIILSDGKSNAVLKSFELTFRKFPNLKVELSYPVNVAPGENIGEKIIITIANNGNLSSGKFDLDIVIGRSYQIPMKKYGLQEGEEGVRLIKNGRIRVDELKPGEVKEIRGKNSLSIPENVENGKYYLGAIVDSGMEVIESSEDDNIFKGFMVVAPKEPSKIFISLKDTTLFYIPKTFNLSIRNSGLEISMTKEWRKCQIRPYIYHLKHASWKDFFWEVNTDEKMVWKITGAQFCKKGGKAEKLDAKVVPMGGSTKVPPAKFRIIFKETKIVFEPVKKKFSINLGNCNIVYLPFWKMCKTAPLKYHFKYVIWDKDVWEINPLKKEFKKIPIEKFCKKCQEGEIIRAEMTLND